MWTNFEKMNEGKQVLFSRTGVQKFITNKSMTQRIALLPYNSIKKIFWYLLLFLHVFFIITFLAVEMSFLTSSLIK